MARRVGVYVTPGTTPLMVIGPRGTETPFVEVTAPVVHEAWYRGMLDPPLSGAVSAIDAYDTTRRRGLPDATVALTPVGATVGRPGIVSGALGSDWGPAP